MTPVMFMSSAPTKLKSGSCISVTVERDALTTVSGICAITSNTTTSPGATETRSVAPIEDATTLIDTLGVIVVNDVDRAFANARAATVSVDA
jgi:hypothetical protein